MNDGQLQVQAHKDELPAQPGKSPSEQQSMTGEFDIVVSDIVAPDGLKAAHLLTLVSANDQDDVCRNAERQADLNL